MYPPKKILVIGTVESVNLDSGTWRPSGAVLAASFGRNALWITPGPVPRWGTSRSVSISGKRLLPYCEVISITYKTALWGNGKQRYVHLFRRRPRLYSDSKLFPTVVRIAGGVSIKTDGIHG